VDGCVDLPRDGLSNVVSGFDMDKAFKEDFVVVWNFDPCVYCFFYGSPLLCRRGDDWVMCIFGRLKKNNTPQTLYSIFERRCKAI
jgi:hypothetical protein